MPMKKIWEVLPDPDSELFQAFENIPKPVVRALFHRGIMDAESARIFLSANAESRTDPFRMRDMQTAVRLILQAVDTGKPIVIYGDYDTDGVTATAMLVRALRSLGALVSPYIPNRAEEGYGLNPTALQNLAGQGAGLILTVDCGARSLEEAKLCSALGVDLIITDHHAPGSELPICAAFLDPKREDCGYPDKNLAGVGVAYRLLQAISQTRPAGGIAPETFLDLVAIGTVADMVPLLGENRSLVQAGLLKINQPDLKKLSPGLQGLIQTSGCRQGSISASSIGFVLGPRLNAAGRIDTAHTALQLLLTENPAEAGQLAEELEARNRERQSLTRATFLEARRMTLAQQEHATADPPFFLMVQKADFNPGIIGLAASKLMDEFYRPSAVVAIEGEFARGSVRSIPGFHITEALDACSEMLERYGGHAAAAGFTIRVERLKELHKQLDTLARQNFQSGPVQPVLAIDAEVSLADLTWDLLRWIQKMEPFGQGNPAPVLTSRGLRVFSKRSVGKDGSHLKLILTDGEMRFDAIGFQFGSRESTIPPVVDIAFCLEENEYYGKQLQMRVLDIQDYETR